MTTAKTTRGYTAIRIDHIDPRAERLTFTAKKDIFIEGVNGASVNIKAGEKFYAVRAASLGDNMFYIVREVIGVKKCSCPSVKQCKHEKLIVAHKAAKVSQQHVEKTAPALVVVSPVPAKVEPAYTMSAEKLAMLTAASQDSAEQTVIVEEPAEPAKDNVTDIGQRGSLNSAQHAASFWEMLPSRKKNIA